MAFKIIQWNLNGFNPRRESLQLLIQEQNPSILCLQETNFKNSFCANLRNFSPVFKNRRNTDFASGGVAVYTNSHIHHEEVKLNTNLEAVAISTITPSKLCICNTYIPNRHEINLTELKQLIDQLPRPFILLGDFNSHNSLWGSRHTDIRGRKIEKLLDEPDLVLLNNNQPTHFNMSNAALSSIDLSLCSSNIAQTINWNVLDDLYDSDHFPIMIEIHNPHPTMYNYTPRWKYKKADWFKFQKEIDSKIDKLESPSVENIHKIDDIVHEFGVAIKKSADASIPKTTSNTFKNQVPWWSPEVEEAIKQKKHAFNIYKRLKTEENKIEFKRRRAISRKIIKLSRRNSWIEFTSSLNYSTPSSEVWRKINMIEGNSTSTRIMALQKTDGSTSSDSTEIANELADNYASNSSNANYAPNFIPFKIETENYIDQRIDENQNLVLNTPLLLSEVTSTLNQCKNTSPGPDNIPNVLLKKLPIKSLKYLLDLLNCIWIYKVFPSLWRESLITPILKPNKDRLKASSYRPIALTCNMCKLMEKIINKRLRWFLENTKFFDKHQSAFRQYRSTLDSLVNLETNIHDAFINDQHLLAVSLDIEKCYEMVWRHRILQILLDNGVDGSTIIFIKNFLQKRLIQVRVNGFLSKQIILENGVPQGSVLSVTLFLISFNDITGCISRPIKKSIFADDLTIYCSGKDLKTTQKLVQSCLDELQKWANKTGFKFSKTKSTCIVFSKNKKINNLNPVLHISKHKLEVVNTIKILGLIFDEKLSWIPHLRYLKDDCKRRLNVIKTLAKRNWGADQKLLTNTYKAIVRSKLDYGSIIYNSAKPQILEIISPIHNAGLRIASGAFVSSPISSILCETDEYPLDVRRKQLSLVYATAIASTKPNPTYEDIFLGKYQDEYEKRPNSTVPIYVRIKTYLLETNFEIPAVAPRRPYNFPYWEFSLPTIITDLQKFPRNQTTSMEYRAALDGLLNNYSNYIPIYTDGSKSTNGCGCAMVTPDKESQFKLPDSYNIFRCETYAILKALNYIKQAIDSYFIIFTDSLSAIEAIKNTSKFDHITQEIHETLWEFSKRGKEVIFTWIPSHSGIKGNKTADSIAKLAYLLPVTDPPIPTFHKDLKIQICQASKALWNERWKTSKITKLHQIRADIFEKPTINLETRRDQVTLTRLRIGHTNLTHSYLITKNEPALCDCCEDPVSISVKHILTECNKYTDKRNQHKIGINLKRMLTDPNLFNRVLDYLQDIDLRHLI